MTLWKTSFVNALIRNYQADTCVKIIKKWHFRRIKLIKIFFRYYIIYVKNIYNSLFPFCQHDILILLSYKIFEYSNVVYTYFVYQKWVQIVTWHGWQVANRIPSIRESVCYLSIKITSEFKIFINHNLQW